ncbi:MAG TPA: hypothetical protein VF671_03030 [Pseudomonas sp.]|jgi:hypothetical protein|uniref:hypothetical protein n=1 Tax=Pseudomonas sp. TaxID=306 RepID=UPI002EDACB15
MGTTTSTATPLAPLSITSVVDSAGTSIPNPGTTQDTELTLSGTGLAGGVVTILDNGDVIGRPSVTVEGLWEISVTVALGTHSFTARGNDGAVSLPWVITVVTAAVKPTIDSVRDSKGEVADGGTTFDTSVTLAGKAAASQQVQIFDGAVSKGTAPVNASGDWTFNASDLARKTYLLKVKALYGEGEESDVWTVTVVEEPLTIAPGTMVLNGLAIKASLPRTGFDAWDNSAIRTATGGSPPYLYFSTNAAVASVNNQGKVVGDSNGSATIRVEDQKGGAVSYNVVVSNVHRLLANEGSLTYAEAVNWMNSVGGVPLAGGASNVLLHVYSTPLSATPHWVCDVGGCTGGAIVFYDPASSGHPFACAWPDSRFSAWCMRLI